MNNTIVKVNNGYGLDLWGNYLSVKIDKNKKDGKHYYSSILLIKDAVDLEKAKEALNI